MWTHQQAVDLCKKIEAVCPAYGCHVALTGGLLYKDGERKDCDILFYRIRQCSEVNHKELFKALELLGVLKMLSGFGWCVKATCDYGSIDCFFPEEIKGEQKYPA